MASGREVAAALADDVSLSPDVRAMLSEYLTKIEGLAGLAGKGLRDVADKSPIQTLYKRSLTAAEGGFDANPVSNAFTHLRVYMQVRGTQAAQGVSMYLNLNGDADAGNHYEYQYIAGEQATGSANYSAADNKIICGQFSAASESTGQFDNLVIDIPFYRSANRKGVLCFSQNYRNAANTKQYIQYISGWWEVADPISRLQFTPSAGNLAAGSHIHVIGIR